MATSVGASIIRNARFQRLASLSRSLQPVVTASRYFPKFPCISYQNGQLSAIRGVHTSYAAFSEAVKGEVLEEEEVEDEYHNIIKDEENSTGVGERREFQAETRKLLDIVARSLYSEKEVFIRELISNASDALEKLRYLSLTEGGVTDSDRPLEIHIGVDSERKCLIIQDTGIGMTREELVENLGTIARSGSKEFLKSVEESDGAKQNIIGQFGVGFYSAFMVADKVDVFTKSYKSDEAYCWTSDGLGEYGISPAEGVQCGTKIVMHLRRDAEKFSDVSNVREVINKYSNFVGVPIYIDGKVVNQVKPLWEREARDISEDEYREFYRFVGDTYDKPRYTLHYKTDAPLTIRAIFYIPEDKPSFFDRSPETKSQISLYCRRVMVISQAQHVLPNWLRFIKGVVDSEDIPLNLSRELLQDSDLIKKLSWVLTNRILKFLSERAKKDPQKYLQFIEDYQHYLREGIITSQGQDAREDIAGLLRYESSKRAVGDKIGLNDYISNMPDGTDKIYYYYAPSRALAESSPYMEALKEKDIEVLFCYDKYDEMVLLNLQQFKGKNLKYLEAEATEDSRANTTVDGSGEGLSQEAADDLQLWLKGKLGPRGVMKTQLTSKLTTHPCMVSVADLATARYILHTSMADSSAEDKNRILNPTLEINPKHPIIVKLHTIKDSDPELATLVADQIYDNALIAAGVLEDARGIVGRLNSLLGKALEKH